MKKIALFLLTCVVFPLFLHGQQLTLATLDWQPYVGSDMEGGGFTAEIVKAALENQGHSVKIEYMPWDDVIAKTAESTYDAAFPEYYSKEREKGFVYSSFFSHSLLGFYKRTDTKASYTELKDLEPYRIGTVKGYINTDEFDSAPFLKKVEADSDLENLKKLFNRELDLIVIDKLVAQSLIAAHMSETTGRLEFMDPPLVIHPLFVVFPRSLPQSGKLCDDFNKGLEMITRDGTVEKIMSRSGLK